MKIRILNLFIISSILIDDWFIVISKSFLVEDFVARSRSSFLLMWVCALG